MPELKPDRRDLAGFLNPWMLSRWSWLSIRRGWGRLWRSPGPNSRFLIATAFFWAVGQGLTDPYKALYLSKLGLSNLAIGGFYALDMSLRIGGVLLGGLAAQRWGHKRTLLVIDFLTWGVAITMLALATEPWHVYVATCLFSTNAMVAGTVTQFLVEDTPLDRRTSTFALFALVFVLPSLFLPVLSGWMIERWSLVPVMRCLFGLTALMTTGGTLWRSRRLQESKAGTPQADLKTLMRDFVRTGDHLLAQELFWPVLGLFLLSSVFINLKTAWQGLFITQSLGLHDALVGQMATAGALAFVIVSLAWVPRLKAGANDRLFFWVCLLTAIPYAALTWATHGWAVLLIGFIGGALGGLQGPLISEHLAAMFPPGREGIAQSLLSCAMQAAVALSLALAGALFETRFGALPWVLAALCGWMGWLAWRILRVRAGSS